MKNFNQLVTGDTLYHIMIDWNESYDSNKLVYSVDELTVKYDPFYTHTSSHLSIPCESAPHSVMIPFESSMKSTSHSDRELYITDMSLLKNFLIDFCYEEIHKAEDKVEEYKKLASNWQEEIDSFNNFKASL